MEGWAAGGEAWKKNGYLSGTMCIKGCDVVPCMGCIRIHFVQRVAAPVQRNSPPQRKFRGDILHFILLDASFVGADPLSASHVTCHVSNQHSWHIPGQTWSCNYPLHHLLTTLPVFVPTVGLMVAMHHVSSQRP